MLLLPNGAPPPAGSEEEKIYILITELLDPVTRETALLELSKKREMYEDLALVLWGGFGESMTIKGSAESRHHVCAVVGDCQRLPRTLTTKLDGTCVKSGLQRFGTTAMCSESFGNEKPVLEW